MTNVIPLPSARGAATRIDLFLRLGEAHYSQLEVLYSEGCLPIRRAIFDASKCRHQLDFLKTLRDDGVELILDTKAAELGALTRYQGRPSGAPWADGTLHLAHAFDADRCRRMAEAIAKEAVERGFDRVLSPSHFLREGLLDGWFEIDIRLCALLRDALDRHGGSHIAVDYPLIIEERLRDEATRSALLNKLAPLPFQNLMLRASHFGADAEAPKLRYFINMLGRLAAGGRPVVVDHVGGLVGRSLLAFGVASGIAHGVDEHLRFDATPWGRPPRETKDDEEGRRGGSTKRISIPLLDRSLTVPELNALARAKGGHRLIVCQDTNCCRSLTDMISNARRHAVVQETKAMDELNRVPDLMRTQHFIDTDLTRADRFARQVKDLKPVAEELKPRPGQSPQAAAESLSARLAKHARRTERIRSSLENLHSVRGLDAPRVPAAQVADRVRLAGSRG